MTSGYAGPLNKVEIEGRAPAITLRVNGHMLPVASAVLEVDAESLPVLTAKLLVIDGVVVGLDGMPARFAEETHAALVSMGWTPPEAAPDAIPELLTVTGPADWTPEQAAAWREALDQIAGDYELKILPPGRSGTETAYLAGWDAAVAAFLSEPAVAAAGAAHMPIIDKLTGRARTSETEESVARGMIEAAALAVSANVGKATA